MMFRNAYTALPTPFSSSGDQVDFDILEARIQYQASAGITGVVPCGTTGETPTLSHQERQLVVAHTVKVARPLGLQVIAGAGANSTITAIEYQKQMEDVGADATLQVVPYYNKPSQEGLYRHFHAIADAAEVPVVLYDVPGRSATGFTVDTVVRLSEHPRIAAIKAASGSLEFVTEVSQRCTLPILSGDDGLTLPIIGLGGVGVISVVSNLVPELMQSMCTEANRGEQALARSQHDRIFELSMALVRLDSNPVPVKAALQMLGWDTGVVRPPLVRLPEHECVVLRRILESLELLEPGLAPKSKRAEMNLYE